MNPQGMSCGPGLAAMLENFPLTDVLPKVFHGSGRLFRIRVEAAWCLTIADWSLLGFVILSVATIYLLFGAAFSAVIVQLRPLTSSNNPRSSERDGSTHPRLRCRCG
jgi:hypothetical protein